MRFIFVGADSRAVPGCAPSSMTVAQAFSAEVLPIMNAPAVIPVDDGVAQPPKSTSLVFSAAVSDEPVLSLRNDKQPESDEYSAKMTQIGFWTSARSTLNLNSLAAARSSVASVGIHEARRSRPDISVRQDQDPVGPPGPRQIERSSFGMCNARPQVLKPSIKDPSSKCSLGHQRWPGPPF